MSIIWIIFCLAFMKINCKSKTIKTKTYLYRIRGLDHYETTAQLTIEEIIYKEFGKGQFHSKKLGLEEI